MYEVFDPRIGKPLFTTRFKLLARFLAWLWRLDYEARGKGWL